MRRPSCPSSLITARPQFFLRIRLSPPSIPISPCSSTPPYLNSSRSTSRSATLLCSSSRRSSSQLCTDSTEMPHDSAYDSPYSPHPRIRTSILVHPPSTTHTHTKVMTHPSDRELSLQPCLAPCGPGCMTGWPEPRSQLSRLRPAAHGLGTTPTKV